MTVWVSYIRIVKSTVRGAFFAPIGRSIKKHRTPAVGTTAGACYANKKKKEERQILRFFTKPEAGKAGLGLVLE